MYKLQNSSFKLSVKSAGAELCSWFSLTLNKELLWQAKPDVWARHAPVLFPIVGKLKENSYQYNGRHYNLPQHGFARDMDFQLIGQEAHSLMFELRENEQSIPHFPFPFNLKITYQLLEQGFACEYHVKNTGNAEMLFSIGAHPGFVCPVLEGEAFEDYVLFFPQDESIERSIIEGGLIAQQTRKLPLQNNNLPLSKELFKEDALVLKKLESDFIILKSEKIQLKFSWNNMPYFGIWTKPGTNPQFLCLEPWAGIADSTLSTGNIREKEGIICLESEQSYTCGFKMEMCLESQKGISQFVD